MERLDEKDNRFESGVNYSGCFVSIGTFAYLTDHAASSGNSFVAGTLDLKTNNADGVTQTLYAVGMSPGATVVGSPTITLKNTGTVNGATMDIVFLIWRATVALIL